ncbi:MAG: ChbG/HpnK family deacetylase [Lachnospiraceae bacterium]|nr:ChbG/HpnK family deacetylase [Lachnospiraceae bacterium]
MFTIDFHADDYAASRENSLRLIELVQTGRIDSMSVLCNIGCFHECMELLKEHWDGFPKKPLLSVHLNLIDGYWLSSRGGKKIIHNSWERIFLHAAFGGPGKKQMEKSFTDEIAAQIAAFLKETAGLKDDAGEPLKLRIDSHVHTHMIPMVFDCLLDAIEQHGLTERVQFIRCSTEPLFMFLTTPGIAGTIAPVNLLKNVMLHVLSHPLRKRLGRMNIHTNRLFGIAMTGNMDEKRVSLLMDKMVNYAKKKDCRLEILSHPGRVIEEPRPEYGPADLHAFYAPERDVEYAMLLSDVPGSVTERLP